jgi:hypothetical protein
MPRIRERGLLPVPGFVKAVSFRRAPSIFHLHYSDRLLGAVAWTGIAMSAAVIVGLPQAGPPWLPMAVWLGLWVLYLSILVVGLAMLVVILSYWPVRNLISRRQFMNAAFNPFHLSTRTGHSAASPGSATK